jgi:putative ABC transport system permease protein
VSAVTLGSALGFTRSYFVPSLPVIPPMYAVVSVLGVSTLVGIVFGVWPALKAARPDPVESFRYE